MAFTNLSTRSAGYLVTHTNWNELVNNWLAVATSAGLIKHEYGGLEVDVSAITTGGIFRGASSGVVSILADFLDGSGRVKQEFGGIEADISGIAAGGILRGTGTGTMGILTKGTGLQVLRVNSGASDLEFATITLPQAAMKTADLTRNSTTSLADDNHLAVALSASTDYAIIMHLIITGSANTDFKYGFTTPTSPTFTGYRQHLYSVGGAASASGNAIQSDNTAQGLGNALTLDIGNANGHGLTMWGAIRNGSNAGNLTLQWAQGSSHSDDTTVGAGSWLCAIPI
jgi:hypothetical protein